MIEDTIQKAEGTGKLTVDEIEQLMSITDKNEMEELFAAARRVREKEFGKKIFTYGFVYFSTYCRNNCSFCIFRHSNDELGRYRKSVEEIVQLSAALQDSEINLSDLTMGEDPYMIANDYEKFLEIVSAVKDQVGISIMASPGAMPQHMFTKVRDAGADFYACYQETYNRKLFESLRLSQSFDDRRNQKIWAMQAGLLAEDGMMIGLGENVRDRAETIAEMSSLGCGQIRAMTFVPQPNTPMQDYVQYDSTDELKAIAVMRLAHPDVLIPASLDVEGTGGLKSRVAAGASVITSIVPPDIGLAGVAQPEFDINDGHRSIDYVRNLAESLGRREATMKEFWDYYESHRPEATLRC